MKKAIEALGNWNREGGGECVSLLVDRRRNTMAFNTQVLLFPENITGKTRKEIG